MINNKLLQNIILDKLIIVGDSRLERLEYSKSKIFVPAFAYSKSYYKSTGSFSSSFLILYSKIIASFVKNGGKIRIISENKLRKNDLELISKGYELKEILKNNLEDQLSELEKITKDIEKNNSPSAFIAHLIKENKLEMKVGKPKTQDPGIHHAKLDLWIDEHENLLSVMGSQNASKNAHMFSQELSEVKYSWHEHEDVSELAKYYKNKFEKWWDDDDEDFDYFDMPEAIKNKLIDEIDDESKNSIDDWIKILPDNAPIDPEDFKKLFPQKIPRIELRCYQAKAVVSWKQNNKRGLIALATGTGKTRMAIYIINKYIEKNIVLIAVPGTPLQSQWEEELIKLLPPQISKNIIKIGGNSNLSTSKLKSVLSKENIKENGPFVIISTYDSLRTKERINIFKELENETIFIADEVHEIGSPKRQAIMNEISFKFRLGLTATPQRNFDPEGSEMINNYFNGEIYNYTTGQAISDGWLAPYNYHTSIVYLNYKEMNRYKTLSNQIYKLRGRIKSEKDQSKKFLLQKELSDKYIIRAAIAKHASNKNEVLVNLLKSDIKFQKDYSIIFAETVNQSNELAELLNKIEIYPYHYHSKLKNLEKRKQLFFNQGGVLINLGMFDQGIDIPELNNVILVSSTTSELTAIQRRGRVLRRYVDGEIDRKPSANIYDFITLPDSSYFNENLKAADFKNLIQTEHKRLKLLSGDAQNKYSYYNDYNTFGEFAELTTTKEDQNE